MSNTEFIIEERVNDNEVRFLFEGLFCQQKVTWHAQLYTCNNYRKKFENNQKSRQFIEITPSDIKNHFDIAICLNLQRITRSEIIKTIIMIKQYKNLAIGKHEFG